MQAIFWLIDTVLGLYAFFIFINVILSWLVAFNIINPYQQFVKMIGDFLYAITEPACSRIRQILPPMGGLDLSPLVLLLLVYFLRILLRTSIAPSLGVYY